MPLVVSARSAGGHALEPAEPLAAFIARQRRRACGDASLHAKQEIVSVRVALDQGTSVFDLEVFLKICGDGFLVRYPDVKIQPVHGSQERTVQNVFSDCEDIHVAVRIRVAPRAGAEENHRMTTSSPLEFAHHASDSRAERGGPTRYRFFDHTTFIAFFAYRINACGPRSAVYTYNKMPYKLLAASALLVGLVAIAAPKAQEVHAAPNILVILSYDPSFPTSADVLKAVSESFPASEYNLSIEFMDAKRLPGNENAALFARALAFSLSRTGVPDIILTVDDAALHFVLKNRSHLFANVPIIFSGVNDYELAQSMDADPLVTGVVEKVSIRETVELAAKMRPRMQTLHVLVDSTESGQSDLHSLRSLSLNVQLEVIDLSSMPERNYYSTIARVPPEDAFLLLSAYNRSSGRPLTFNESLTRILSAARAPVFHLWKHGIGDGLVGGMVSSHYEQVKIAAGIAQRILRGTPPGAIPVVEESPNIYLFDWKVARRYGMDPHHLPPNTIFVNRPPSFRESFPDLFWGLTAAAVLVVALVSMMAIILGYRLSIERKLARNLDFMNALIGAIEEPVYVKDASGRYVMANPSFAAWFGVNRSEIVGKETRSLKSEEVAGRIDEIDAEVLATGEPRTDDLDFLVRGRRKVVRMTKIPLKNMEGRQVLLGTMHDLTTDRLRAETLEKMVDERTAELREANAALERLAATDQLTGIANRRKLEVELDAEFSRRGRYGTPFSVVMVDIDHFKAVNDMFGHETGDTVLIGIAKTITACSRTTDLVGRWGGEEFLILCRNEDAAGASAFAEKLRAAIEGASFIPQRPITASLGVAACGDEDVPRTLIARADARLYAAKAAGRNRVFS